MHLPFQRVGEKLAALAQKRHTVGAFGDTGGAPF